LVVTRPALSLAVVGADHLNKRGPTRRFEIALCAPGEPVELRPEPKNSADENAIAVYSNRGVQIGYLTAERAPLFKAMLARGEEITTIFQRAASYGAVIRAAFGGKIPTLPAERPPDPPAAETDFYPDFDPGFD
jgi:hypothetical protein